MGRFGILKLKLMHSMHEPQEYEFLASYENHVKKLMQIVRHQTVVRIHCNL